MIETSNIYMIKLRKWIKSLRNEQNIYYGRRTENCYLFLRGTESQLSHGKFENKSN